MAKRCGLDPYLFLLFVFFFLLSLVVLCVIVRFLSANVTCVARPNPNPELYPNTSPNLNPDSARVAAILANELHLHHGAAEQEVHAALQGDRPSRQVFLELCDQD